MGDFFTNLVYSKEDVITFPAGIPGFEKNKEFVILKIPEYVPFDWLVCVDGSKLRFVIINPLLFDPAYSPRVDKEQLAELGIERADDLLLYVIVTIKHNPADSTANFIGPIFINRAKRIGKQIILEDDRYSTRELILRKK